MLKFKLQVAHENAQKILLKNKLKRINNQENLNPIHLNLDDEVKLKNNQRENKLSPFYTGPFVVKSINDPNVEIEYSFYSFSINIRSIEDIAYFITIIT